MSLLWYHPLPPTHTHAFKSFLTLLLISGFWLFSFHLIMSFSQAPPLWFVGLSFEPGPVTILAYNCQPARGGGPFAALQGCRTKTVSSKEFVVETS